MKTKKKGFHPDSARFSAHIFCPNSKGGGGGGGHDSILRTMYWYLCITGSPKGGARHMAILCSRKISVFMCKSLVYFRVPTLWGSAPSLCLL